jgi:hypothetical protein
VVMVVSRRVGQVTLAVSERTSCRNLNGLKAIVDVIRVLRRFLKTFRESEQPSSAQPSSRRMSRQAGSMFGGFQSRAGYPSKRAGSRCRYVLRTALKVKAAGTPGLRMPPESAGTGSVKIKGLAGRSGRATSTVRFQRVRHKSGAKRPRRSPYKPGHCRTSSDPPVCPPLEWSGAPAAIIAEPSGLRRAEARLTSG